MDGSIMLTAPSDLETKTFTTGPPFIISTTIDLSWNYDISGNPVFEFVLELLESLDFVISGSCGGLMIKREVDIDVTTKGRPTKNQRHILYILEDKIIKMFPQYDWDFHTHYGKK